MSEKEFKIRTYGKSELAMMYFPKLSKRAAAQKLRTWVKTNPRLNEIYFEAPMINPPMLFF